KLMDRVLSRYISRKVLSVTNKWFSHGRSSGVKDQANLVEAPIASSLAPPSPDLHVPSSRSDVQAGQCAYQRRNPLRYQTHCLIPHLRSYGQLQGVSASLPLYVELHPHSERSNAGRPCECFSLYFGKSLSTEYPVLTLPV